MNRFVVSAVAEVDFGGLKEFSLNGLDGDFVLVSGQNESGKSTLAEFISWMIAGPAGDAASASRFGTSQSNVRGRLLGTLEDQPLDLDGSFKILDSGAPKDTPNRNRRAPRSGTLGEVNIDGAQLLNRLGGLTPSAFSLLYRIGSETAHLLEHEKNLVGLFAKYATGAISSSINPREVIKDLDSKVKQTENKLNALAGTSGRRAEVSRRLEEAKVRPTRIREIELKINGLEVERKDVDRSITEAAQKQAHISAAIKDFDRVKDAKDAEHELSEADRLPVDVEPIADDLDSIVGTAGRLETTRGDVVTSEASVNAACRAIGLDAATLARHTLTNAHQQAFSEAASAVIDKHKRLATAEDSRNAHEEKMTKARYHADTCLSQGIQDGAQLRRRILDIDKVVALGNLAYAADQASQNVGRCELALEAAKSGSSIGSQSSKTLLNDPWRAALPAVIALAGAFLGEFANRAVSLVAGMVGLIVGIAVTRVVGGKTVAFAPASADQVDVASSNLERARIELKEKLGSLNYALEALGLPPVGAREAAIHVNDLERSLVALADVVTLESLTEGLDHAVAQCKIALSTAESTYSGLFEQRDMTKVSETDIWVFLGRYGGAIEGASRHARLVEACEKMETEFATMTKGVERWHGSDALVIAEHAKKFIITRDERKRLAEKAKRLRNEADIALGEAPQVRELLKSHDKFALEADLPSATASVESVKARRTKIDEEIGGLKAELKEKNEGELVADLTEDLGRINEDIEDLVREYTSLMVAFEAVTTIVDQYELRNQGPVIEEAQKLIALVDPAFGELHIDRSEDDPKLMVNRKGLRVTVQRLSTGARALVYFALRLAFQTVDAQGRPASLPLLCDDPLVTVDDRRVEPLMRLLQKVSEQRQVIFLTCHARETTIAAKIGARIIPMPGSLTPSS